MKSLVRFLPLSLWLATLAEGGIFPSHAAEAPDAGVPPQHSFLDAWRFGGDFRLRQEAFNHVPMKTGNEARGGANDYFRFRTRLWGTFAPNNRLALNVRLLNEFRHVLEPPHSHSWRWPDELVLDQLNLVLRSEDQTLQATIGRQDFLPEGGFRLFGDGTPRDGSRSAYMDAVTVVARDEADRTRLTLFGAYDNAVDPLAIGDIDRDLNGYTSNATGMDESGAGMLLRHSFSDRGRATAYYLWKHDSASRRPDGTRRPNEDLHTVGTRLLVPLSGILGAEGELAGQWSPSSDADRRALMAAAALSADWRDAACKPRLSLNGLYLSGDDPDTAGTEAWNPPWARNPWLSMLMWYTCDTDGIGQWQNIFYVWAEGSAMPREGHRLKACVGPMYAPEADGVGGGHERGWLGSCRYDFPLLGTTDDPPRLYGHIFAEVLLPGNYYASSADLAWFLRWEVSLAF